MKYTALFFSALALILIQHVRALQDDTMDTSKTAINLLDPSYGSFSSGILRSHSGSRYTVNRNKTLYVSASFGYRILVSIRFIDLRPYNQDRLTLFSVNGPQASVTFSNSGSFRKKSYYPSEDLTYDVPNGQLGITFSTGSYSTNYGYDGFELVYTVQADWLQCKSRDFRCNNGRCIASILKCDGHNHCGDKSSEKNCPIFNPGSGRKIGIATGSVFLIIAIACGVYIVCRRARGSVTETHTVINSHPPPPTNLPSYPPVYPQPGTYPHPGTYPPPPPPYSQGVVNPTYH